MKMTRRQCAKIAKAYAASILRNTMQGGADSDFLDQDDIIQINANLQQIADRICSDRFDTFDECVLAQTP